MNYIFNFKFIKIISYVSARYIQVERQESHKHRYNYYYGFQIIIGAIIKGLIISMLSLALGVFKPMIIVFASFGILRIFAGGFHMESYAKCIYFSLLVILTGAFIGKYVEYHPIINSVTFLFTLVTFLLYTPVENESRPIKSNEIKKFRIMSLTNLLLLFILNTIFIQQTAISVGITISGTIVLPIFNKKIKGTKTNSM